MNVFPIIFFIRVGGRGYGEGPKKTKQKKISKYMFVSDSIKLRFQSLTMK